MWKRSLVAIVVLLCLIGSSPLVFAQDTQKKNPRELVLRIKSTSVDELKKRSFLELNFLKNAVYASKGYRFADDRLWLNEFFCGRTYTAKRSTVAAASAAISSWISKLKKETSWDLDGFAFPPCKEGGAIDPDQMKALANIRVALFKKIESFGNIRAVDAALDAEFEKMPKEGNYFWVLGKPVSHDALSGPGRESIRRDVHGYNRMLYVIKNVQAFDAMELLGLYAGDMIFLRQAIEAKYGKQFSGVLGWEISQTIGVVESKKEYDPRKLPVEIQAKIQMLDAIIQNILRSDLDNIPAALKNKSVEFYKPEPSEEEDSDNGGSYGGAAC